jgi:hypothetical protein
MGESMADSTQVKSIKTKKRIAGSGSLFPAFSIKSKNLSKKVLGLFSILFIKD